MSMCCHLHYTPADDVSFALGGPNSVSDGIPNDDASYECFLLVGSVVQGGGVEE